MWILLSSPGVPLQAAYASDPTLADAVFDLLELVFPGIRTARAHGQAFGATWESASTPFVAREGGRVLAHVGLMAFPMVVAGRPMTVGAVHGVATHPSCRRRGIYRSVMEELLSSAAAERLGTLALTTAHPEYFEPFGFRVVPESVFRAQVSPRRGPSASRLLDLPGSAADRALVHRLLDQRQPVSRMLGVGPEKACWAFYEFRSSVRYLPELDLAVVSERRAGGLALFDVVGPRLPALDELLDGLAEPVGELVAFFATDRLGGPFRTEPHDLAGGPLSLQPGEAGWVFMVRGPFAAEGRALMLPRPARC